MQSIVVEEVVALALKEYNPLFQLTDLTAKVTTIVTSEPIGDTTPLKSVGTKPKHEHRKHSRKS
jgi:hypothetical protein